MTGIYQIINNKNGKRYIGQSKNLSHRRSCHVYDLKNAKHRSAAMQKEYDENPDAFCFEILCECKQEELDDLEIYFIAKYKTDCSEFGYNISPGANIVAESTRKSISERQKGNRYMCGKKLSDEWKQHLAEAQPHKKKIECIETKQIYESFADAARKTGLNRTKIVSVCTGTRKSTGGLHFRYADTE